MPSNDFATLSPINYEQKCCCVLVLDVSGSMKGAPINELNQGLSQFYSDIQEDSVTANRLELSIVEFSDTIDTILQPSLISNFEMPQLRTKGSTKLVDGVREAIQIVKSRKVYYKDSGQPYYRPWIILITDGSPDEDQDTEGLTREIDEGMTKKEFYFFAIGVSNADMQMLSSISHSSMPPSKLQGLKFSEFFKWLSASLSSVASSKDGDKIALPKPDVWRTLEL